MHARFGLERSRYAREDLDDWLLAGRGRALVVMGYVQRLLALTRCMAQLAHYFSSPVQLILRLTLDNPATEIAILNNIEQIWDRWFLLLAGGQRDGS